jgi:glucose/arabinose dehydrogenase
MMLRFLSVVLLLAAGLGVLLIAEQKQPFTEVQVVGHVLKPQQVEPTDERVGSLQAPPGFRVEKFAEGLGKPRILAAAADGSVYVTRREPGDLVLLKDNDNDGRADSMTVVARKEDLHGIAIHGDRLYLATVTELFVADRRNDGSVGELKKIIGDLPDGGQHPNRTLGVGPDGTLYISIGSTCNECDEPNEEHATILRTKTDGSDRKIFASGLRNTVGFGWHPETKQLWGFDHGTDWLGDDAQREELNLIEEGQKYGWPYVFDERMLNPRISPDGKTNEQWAKESRAPVSFYTPHAAPMQMVFYTGSQFPSEFRNDAFCAMRGSWNRKPPSGYEVVRLRFRNGKPASTEPFLTGFLQKRGEEWAQFGRPVGVAVACDGSLLVSDDTNGVIYRVSHGGTQTQRTRQAEPRR